MHVKTDRQAAATEVDECAGFNHSPVCIPVLDDPVLARAEEVVRAGLEAQAGHAVLVRVQGAVAVTEVQAPDLDGLVRAARHQDGAVVGDVDAHHGQLVAVQGQEELQAVLIVHAHGAVQQAHSQHEAVLRLGGAVAQAQHVVFHGQLPAVGGAMPGWAPARRS